MTTPTAEIVTIPFKDDEILAVDVNGKPFIVLRPALESIGLNAARQIAKLQAQPWSTTAVTAVVAADGKPRDQMTCDVRSFLMMLATIPASRVSEAAQPKLIAYQNEVADAIEAYWTKGGAINESASDEQLADLADEIEAKRAGRARRRIELLALMGDAVDPRWRDSRMRHEYALVVGEKPDIAPEDRLLTVDGYLVDRGVSKADLVSVRSTFGKRLKAAYMLAHGEEPGAVSALVAGRERDVKAYYERDRNLFDEVFDGWYAHLAPATLPGIAA